MPCPVPAVASSPARAPRDGGCHTRVTLLRHDGLHAVRFSSGGSHVRVLIVEDEPKLADVMRRALVGQGFSVALELRGDTALERASSEPFDAIVLDVMLPGINGFDVCRLLRERDVTTPVIMLTARGGINDRVTGLEN